MMMYCDVCGTTDPLSPHRRYWVDDCESKMCVSAPVDLGKPDAVLDGAIICDHCFGALSRLATSGRGE